MLNTCFGFVKFTNEQNHLLLYLHNAAKLHEAVLEYYFSYGKNAVSVVLPNLFQQVFQTKKERESELNAIFKVCFIVTFYHCKSVALDVFDSGIITLVVEMVVVGGTIGVFIYYSKFQKGHFCNL